MFTTSSAVHQKQIVNVRIMTFPRHHLRVSFIELTPYVKIDQITEDGYQISGILVNLLNCLASSLNFSYELAIPPDKTWGRKYPNGTWNGFIAMLQRNETDLVLGIIGVNYDRSQAIRFTQEYDLITISILASASKQGSISFFSFLMSIRVEIWVAIALSFLALTVTSTTVDVVNSTLLSFFFTRYYINLWLYLSALFNEGSSRRPPTRWSQVLLSMWLIFVLIFSTCLSGNFKAALMADDDSDVMYTIADLADRDDVFPLLTISSFYSLIFQTAELESYRRVYQKAVRNPEKCFIDSSELVSYETFQKVKDGTHALAFNPSIAKSYLSQYFSKFTGPRKFYFVEETTFYYQISFGVRRDFSPELLNHLNDRILWIKESGLISFWEKELMRDYWKVEADDNAQEESPLGFSHLLSFFWLMAVLQAFCALQLLLEMYIRRKKTCFGLGTQSTTVTFTS